MKLTAILLYFIIQTTVGCQKNKPNPGILFDVSKGKQLLEDCMGSNLQNEVSSFWTPNKKEYQDLLLNLYKLSKTIKEPNDYLFQYLGVELNGKKYIYINAFIKSQLDEVMRVHKDLETSTVVFCGGGSLFWRALYDVNLKEFTKIEINAPE